jgi:pimeloyl-ACP methyl ester carboxylesterase
MRSNAFPELPKFTAPSGLGAQAGMRMGAQLPSKTDEDTFYDPRWLFSSNQTNDDEPYYVLIGGYGTKWDNRESDWQKTIDNLGLEPGQYGFFQWNTDRWANDPDASSNRETADAAADMARQIGDHKNVVLLGHSKGGALAMDYLAGIAEGRLEPNPNVIGAFTVDSPLDSGLLSALAKFSRNSSHLEPSMSYWGQPSSYVAVPTDRLSNLPDALKEYGMHTIINNYDNPNDVVGHNDIPGIKRILVPRGDALKGHSIVPIAGDINGVHGLAYQDPDVARQISEAVKTALVEKSTRVR